MTFKELAASVELTDYCTAHGYSLSWCRWLENIMFTRRPDGAEFTPKAGVSASKIFQAVVDARNNSSLDPLMVFLEPVKYPSLDVIL